MFMLPILDQIIYLKPAPADRSQMPLLGALLKPQMGHTFPNLGLESYF